MADNKTSDPSRGGTAKPGGGAGQSAKDRSRAENRAVSTKAPAGRTKKQPNAPGGAPAAGKGAKGGVGPGRGAGGTGGGNRPKPGRSPAQAPAPRRISAAMLTWGAVGLVVVIVAVLVIVKVVSGSSTANASYTPVTPAPASVVHDVTAIPASVFDKVGVTSQQVPVNPPSVLSNQPPLTLNGKSPSMLYVGAEYCPYCAAERWAMTAALSRFGTWSNLKVTASSHTDVDAATHTFSYYGSNYSSPYLHFVPVEMDTNIPCSSCTSSNGYQPLQSLTKEEATIATKYSGPQYNPNATSSGGISFPFVSINNKVLFSGASFDPGILAGQSWSQIAAGLSNPSNPATQAIVTTSNYMSAAICASTNGQPGSVCTSSGVQAAAKALKLG